MLLMTPFDINGMRLANRLVLTAMVTRLSGEDGLVNDDILARYLRFARGEVGLIVVEAMAVHSAKSGPLLRISEDRFVPGLRALAKAVHDASPSKIVPQIIHFLKVARSGWRQKIVDLSKDDIRLIIQQYADAAGRARECGFDGVELHMAHAYTQSSFLSRLNARKDEYGGTLENRMRLMGETILAVRARVGRDFPLGVRFDAEECVKGGYTVVESREIALRMAQLGVDYISLSAGGKFEDAVHKPGEPLYPYTGYSGDRCMPSAQYPDGANLYMAEAAKRYLLDRGFSTPVVATGKIGTSRLAERVLATGQADLVGMARALLADPDLPRKIREGREDKVIRCVYGNVCKNLDENFRKVVCFLWPKGALQAPESADSVSPRWPDGGAGLVAEASHGRVTLRWRAAVDNEEVYGYEVFRAEGAEEFAHLATARGAMTSFIDSTVVGGRAYRYRLRAFDLAGNRSEDSNVAETSVPSAVPTTS